MNEPLKMIEKCKIFIELKQSGNKNRRKSTKLNHKINIKAIEVGGKNLSIKLFTIIVISDL